MDFERLAESAKTCLESGFSLPVAGAFEPSTILSLVARKSIIQSMAKAIYGTNPAELIEKHYLSWTYTYRDIQVKVRPLSPSDKCRFVRKPKYVMECYNEIRLTNNKLIIPLTMEHAELFLFGILPLSEPSKLLEWTESALLITDRDTHKLTKIMYQIGSPRGELALYDRLVAFRLEDAALSAMYEINKSMAGYCSVDYERLEILHSWLCMQMVVYYQNSYGEYSYPKPIEVCSEWTDYLDFESWSLRNGYCKGHSIDRIINGDHYKPSNVHWVERSAELFLMSRFYPAHKYDTYVSRYSLFTKKIAIHGETKTIIEWENQTGIPSGILYSRHRLGWKDEEILDPMRRRPNEYLSKLITISGVTKTVKEWAEETGISIKTIVSRIRYKWDEDKLLSPPRTMKKMQSKKTLEQ